LLALVCLLGCSKEPERAPQLPQAGRPTEESPPESVDVMALRRLAAAVDTLESGPPDPSHADLVHALRATADVLEALPGARSREVVGLRAVAQRLEGSPRRSRAHADLVVEGFGHLSAALFLRAVPTDREDEYREAVIALREAVSRVRPGRPLLAQRQATSAAFRATADAVHLALGAEPPFQQALGTRDGSLGTVAEEIDEARAEILQLGRSGWTVSRRRTARALSSLADVLDAAASDDAARVSARSIHDLADRLAASSSIEARQAEWLKTGLGTALQSLERSGRDAEATRRWARDARAAVASIADDEPLTFQPAAVQDGLRASLDAFAAVWQPSRPTGPAGAASVSSALRR
jgi:hypothetical protein